MNARKILDYAITAVAGAVAAFTSREVMGQHVAFILLLPPLAAIFVFVTLQRIATTAVDHHRGFRRWLVPLAEFEGIWANYSERHGQKHVGVANLHYHPATHAHYISGRSFVEDGQRAATWHSAPLIFDARKLQAEYRFSGESMSKAMAEGGSEIQNVEGWTTLGFDRAKRSVGEGYFINFHPEPVRRTFRLERLTNQALARLRKERGFAAESDFERHLSELELE